MLCKHLEVILFFFELRKNTGNEYYNGDGKRLLLEIFFFNLDFGNKQKSYLKNSSNFVASDYFFQKILNSCLTFFITSKLKDCAK